eukprot:Colp12_sorted_trinity150504_noHs@15596
MAPPVESGRLQAAPAVQQEKRLSLHYSGGKVPRLQAPAPLFENHDILAVAHKKRTAPEFIPGQSINIFKQPEKKLPTVVPPQNLNFYSNLIEGVFKRRKQHQPQLARRTLEGTIIDPEEDVASKPLLVSSAPIHHYDHMDKRGESLMASEPLPYGVTGSKAVPLRDLLRAPQAAGLGSHSVSPCRRRHVPAPPTSVTLHLRTERRHTRSPDHMGEHRYEKKHIPEMHTRHFKPFVQEPNNVLQPLAREPEVQELPDVSSSQGSSVTTITVKDLKDLIPELSKRKIGWNGSAMKAHMVFGEAGDKSDSGSLPPLQAILITPP